MTTTSRPAGAHIVGRFPRPVPRRRRHRGWPRGTRHRIEAAQSVLPAFGVSTVCGIGGEFYSRADAIAILDLYAALAEPIAAG